MAILQRLMLKRGQLIYRRAQLIRERRSAEVVERDLKMVTARIIRMELRAQQMETVGSVSV
jgi:hypothetical protein